MGGTGKAEDAKLPDAGISLKQCPREWEAGKGGVPDSVTSAQRVEGVKSGPQGRKKGRGLDTRRVRKKSLTLDYTPGCSV